VILPTPIIFSRIFRAVIFNSQLPTCTKTRVKSHKMAYKTSRNRLRVDLCPRPCREAYFVFFRRTWGPREGKELGRGPRAKRLRITAPGGGKNRRRRNSYINSTNQRITNERGDMINDPLFTVVGRHRKTYPRL